MRKRLVTPLAADETDPQRLRHQLVQLRRELHAAQGRPAERIEIPILTRLAATLLRQKFRPIGRGCRHPVSAA